jgi:hypothetical protein
MNLLWWKRKPKESYHWDDARPEEKFLVRDTDDKVMVSVWQGYSRSSPWCVFKNGAGYGKYLSEESARKKAESLVL